MEQISEGIVVLTVAQLDEVAGGFSLAGAVISYVGEKMVDGILSSTHSEPFPQMSDVTAP